MISLDVSESALGIIDMSLKLGLNGNFEKKLVHF